MKKVAYYLVYFVFSLLLILWLPVAALTVFLFDDPIRGPLDLGIRLSTVLIVLLFPVFYWKGQKSSKIAFIEDQSLVKILLPWLWPSIVPGWILLFGYVISALMYKTH